MPTENEILVMNHVFSSLHSAGYVPHKIDDAYVDSLASIDDAIARVDDLDQVMVEFANPDLDVVWVVFWFGMIDCEGVPCIDDYADHPVMNTIYEELSSKSWLY